MFWPFARRISPPPDDPDSYTLPESLRPLWEQIESFPLDNPDQPFPFSARLAQEQNWTIQFAQRVIREYRKFLLLTTMQFVVPAKAVDEVWHLHLIYTRSYWDELCKKVLRRKLHHSPGDGSSSGTNNLQHKYIETLQLYLRFFGHPPADIWGPRDIQAARAAERGQ